MCIIDEESAQLITALKGLLGKSFSKRYINTVDGPMSFEDAYKKGLAENMRLRRLCNRLYNGMQEFCRGCDDWEHMKRHLQKIHDGTR